MPLILFVLLFNLLVFKHEVEECFYFRCSQAKVLKVVFKKSPDPLLVFVTLYWNKAIASIPNIFNKKDLRTVASDATCYAWGLQMWIALTYDCI